MGLFSDPGERAKAMGFFGFVMSGGGAVGAGALCLVGQLAIERDPVDDHGFDIGRRVLDGTA